MTRAQIMKQVEEVREACRNPVRPPIYEVDARGYTREDGDLILWGVVHGTDTLGFQKGLVNRDP